MNNRSWRETAVLTAAGGLLLVMMTQPAFRSFFFGENFLYLGQYRAHNNHFWQAVLSPSDNIFFRPVFCAFSLPWYFVLPLNPWVFHFRNLIFSVLNLLIFHRVLLRLVIARHARVLAFSFFVLSKIHLTTIGYINIYDSIIMLMLLLLTILFFLRYVANRRWFDYALGLLFCALSIFSKDYGLVVVVVVMGLFMTRVTDEREKPAAAKYWGLRFSPLLIATLVYLWLRHNIVGLLSSSSNAIYSPAISFGLTLRKLLIFTSTMANLSFFANGTSGAPGLSAYVPSTVSIFGFHVSLFEAALYFGFMLLLLLTVWKGLRSWRLLLFSLVWIAAYFGPTLLTRNIQMYYMYEPLAGVAVLLGICQVQANRYRQIVWGFAILIIAVNGFISNHASTYDWQFVANGAARIQEPVLKTHRGEPIESISFITSAQPFWQYALTADLKGPMLQELMKRPGLRVRFIDPADLPAMRVAPTPVDLFFDIDNGFTAYDNTESRLNEAPSRILILNAINPTRTETAQGFNVQPNGQSALSLDCQNATPDTVVMFDETALSTTYGNPKLVTALLPDELYAQSGRHEVYLKNKSEESNRLAFNVDPRK